MLSKQIFSKNKLYFGKMLDLLTKEEIKVILSESVNGTSGNLENKDEIIRRIEKDNWDKGVKIFNDVIQYRSQSVV